MTTAELTMVLKSRVVGSLDRIIATYDPEKVVPYNRDEYSRVRSMAFALQGYLTRLPEELPEELHIPYACEELRGRLDGSLFYSRLHVDFALSTINTQLRDCRFITADSKDYKREFALPEF